MLFTLSCDENPDDPGSTQGGFIERHENLKIIAFLKPALERCQQVVHFDPTITYVDRVARANGDGTDVLVVVAHNAFSDPSANGTRFIFCKDPPGHGFGKQDQAAHLIGDELILAGISQQVGTVDEDVYECCKFSKDTVDIEVLFQTSPRDQAKMREPSYHHDAAEAITRGLSKTYGFTYIPDVPDAEKFQVYDQQGKLVGVYLILEEARTKANQVHGAVRDPTHKIIYVWSQPPTPDKGGDMLTKKDYVTAALVAVVGLLLGALGFSHAIPEADLTKLVFGFVTGVFALLTGPGQSATPPSK